METPLTDIIDRISILKLKMERIGQQQFQEEFDAHQAALKKFENRGTHIRQEWIDILYEINKETWDLTVSIVQTAKKENELAKIGRLHLERLILNKKRVAVKNKIAEETGSGVRDIEVN